MTDRFPHPSEFLLQSVPNLSHLPNLPSLPSMPAPTAAMIESNRVAPYQVPEPFSMNFMNFVRNIDPQFPNPNPTPTPALVNMAVGSDLFGLDVNMNQSRQIGPNFNTFGGPFIGNHKRMHDLQCSIPDEYRVSVHATKPDPSGALNLLMPFKEGRLGDEVLFHIFYNFGGEVYQLWAAAELYNRGWRYHKTQQVWITRSQFSVHDQSPTHETAMYTYFDKNLFRKMTREMTIFFEEIEGRPLVPSHEDLFNKRF